MSKIFTAKRVGTDDFSRPLLKIKVNDSVVYLADVDLGDGDCTTNGIPGRWHTVSIDGEPIAPIKKDIQLVEESL